LLTPATFAHRLGPVLFALLIASPARATGGEIVVLGKDGPRVLAAAPSARIIDDGRALPRLQAIDPDAPGRYIVVLDEPHSAPTFAEAVRLRQSLVASFRGTLAAVAARQPLRAGAEPLRIVQTFDRLLAGCLVVGPRGIDADLRTLPGVRSVSPDAHVTALADGVSQVHGDQVARLFGATARGVRVGIIDTGIDYRHPAFGGALGAGARVAGGWDFVNHDPDPIDDNGHGTFVAGIVGAQGGGITGMAPGVTLYAYKVLDRFGGGFLSNVIAGLERAADPDQDPATDDALDAVNLSLGAFDPVGDDPASIAVNALDSLGTFCVVAAGNFGSQFAIASPGIARRAITVGAADGDSLASFSSRGPSFTLGIKPELVAPGVAITSAWPGGGSRTLSGTSAATPFVTGAVALLRQLHPEWSHEELRSALVASAADLRLHTFEQGAGRLDVLAAARSQVFVSPATLTFDRTSTLVRDVVQSETLRVRVRGPGTTTVTFRLRTAPLPAGVELALSPATLRLAPGEEGRVSATLRVAADRAPRREPPFIVDGTIEAIAAGQVAAVPFSQHDCLKLHVTTEGRDGFGAVCDHERPWPSAGPFEPFYYLPPGTYDLMSFPETVTGVPFLARQDVALTSDSTVDVPATAALSTVRWNPVDERGVPLQFEQKWFPETSLKLRHVSGTSLTTLNFQFLSFNPGLLLPVTNGSYTLEWAFADHVGDLRYDIAGSVPGPFFDQTITNDRAALRRTVEHVRPIRADPTVEQEFALAPFGNGYIGGAQFNPFAVHHAGPYQVVRWISPVPERGHLRLARWTRLLDPPTTATLGWGAVWGLDRNDTTLVLPAQLPLDPLLVITSPDLPFGSGPGTFAGSLSVVGDSLRVGPGSYGGPAFTDGVTSVLRGPATEFELSEAGRVVAADTVAGEFDIDRFNGWKHALPHAGVWDVTLRSRGWTVAGVPNVTTVRTSFDSRRPVRARNGLQALAVLANGNPAEQITFGRSRDPHVELVLRPGDENTSVAVEVGHPGDLLWRALPIARDRLYCRAALPACEGDMALRVRIGPAPGFEGGPLEIEMAPAFRARVLASTHAHLVESAYDANGVHIAWDHLVAGDSVFVERAEGTGPFVEWGAVVVGADGLARLTDPAVQPARTYTYRALGSESIARVQVAAAPVPATLALGFAPNPARGELLAVIGVERQAPITLSLYDVQGRVVGRRHFDALSPGEHVVNLSPGLRPRAGLYFVRLEREGASLIRRVTLLE